MALWEGAFQVSSRRLRIRVGSLDPFPLPPVLADVFLGLLVEASREGRQVRAASTSELVVPDDMRLCHHKL